MQNTPDRNGQGLRGCADGSAMVELMIGLIAILAIAAGLLQVASLSNTQTDSMVRARQAAGELAMVDNPQVLAAPDYIRDWNEGPDRRRHSRDDRHNNADPALFDNTIVNRAAPSAGAWQRLDTVPADALPELRDDMAPALLFGMVNGDDTRTVPLMTAVQTLLYRADHITIDSRVWMTSTRGLY